MPCSGSLNYVVIESHDHRQSVFFLVHLIQREHLSKSFVCLYLANNPMRYSLILRGWEWVWLGCGGEVPFSLNINSFLKNISVFRQFYRYRWLQIWVCFPEKVIVLVFLWDYMKEEKNRSFSYLKLYSRELWKKKKTMKTR